MLNFRYNFYHNDSQRTVDKIMASAHKHGIGLTNSRRSMNSLYSYGPNYFLCKYTHLNNSEAKIN